MHEAVKQRAGRSRVRKVLGGAGYVLLALLLVAVLGTYLPATPVVGQIGTLVTSLLAPWLVVIAIIGLVMGIRAWRRGRRRAGPILTAMSAFIALGAGSVIAATAAAAREHGLKIDYTRIFGEGFVYGTGYAPDRSFVYTTTAGQPLSIHLWLPSKGRPKGKLPILVNVHGGGWTTGWPTIRGRDMQWFADHGWMVFSAQYTLSTPDRHMWQRAPEEVGCALAWVSRNAERLGGDLGRVALLGDSAGGNLVVNAGYMASAGKLASACGGPPPPIRAILTLYPGVDPGASQDHSQPANPKNMLESYTGGTLRQYPDRYAAISSMNKIVPGAPPTLILLGESDHMVPPQRTYDFARQARRVGIPVEVIRIPFGDHPFDAVAGSIGHQMFREASLRFLARYAAPIASPAAAR